MILFLKVYLIFFNFFTFCYITNAHNCSYLLNCRNTPTFIVVILNGTWSFIDHENRELFSLSVHTLSLKWYTYVVSSHEYLLGQIYLGSFTLEGKGLNNFISPSQWPCTESQLGYWKSTNNVWSINTAENNLLADEKGHWKSGAGSYLYVQLYYISVVSPLSRKIA